MSSVNPWNPGRNYDLSRLLGSWITEIAHDFKGASTPVFSPKTTKP